jgi:REP element-mobilizing transposase RayT
MSVSKIVQTIKSITAREIFKMYPEVKRELWGGNFRTSGFYTNTVEQYGNKGVIRKYVENQGKTYKQLHFEQLKLW